MREYYQSGQELGAALPDWQPCPWPARQILQGSRCRPEPLILAYASDLFAAHQLAPDARSWAWLLREPESNLAEFSVQVEQVATLADPIHSAVVDQRQGKAVGSLALMRADTTRGVVEVGHVYFSPLLSQTAMATEMHWLLIQYVFDTLGYRRYEWKCNSPNMPSGRAARRLGFQYEGRFRQALVSKGHDWDTDRFSMIDGEWPQLDNAMRQWLATDNFTADGQQHRTLESFR